MKARPGREVGPGASSEKLLPHTVHLQEMAEVMQEMGTTKPILGGDLAL
jgi:hypothetical protein